MSLENRYKEIIKEMDDNLYISNNSNPFFNKLISLKEEFNTTEYGNEIIKQINWELLFLKLFIENYELKISENDKEYIFSFNEECIDYLENRVNKTSNLLLKTRYSLILWELDKSKLNHRCFIDNVLNLFEKGNKIINSNSKQVIKDMVINGFKFSKYSQNYKFEELKKVILDLIKDDSIDYPYFRRDLIIYILDNKNFKKDDFKGLEEICFKLALNDKREENQIEFLELGQKISNKTGYDKYDWMEEIAKIYEKLAENESNSFLKDEYYMYAINYYIKLINNTKKK